MEGWIKLHRKLTDWEWYGDLPVRTLFQHLLLIVNYEDKLWRGKLLVKRGQTIISLANLAAGACLTVQQTRTALNKLKLTNEITTESTNEYTIITVCKYAQYQSCDEDEQQTNQQTDNTPVNTPNNKPNNTSITTTKEIKNIRSKENINNTPYIVPLNVEPTPKAKVEKLNPETILTDETAEFRELILRWLDYKKKQHKFTYKSPDSLKSFIKQLKKLSGGEYETAAEIVEQSIANGWSGVFELKTIKQQPPQPQLTTRTEIDEQGNTIAVWPDGTRARLGIGEYINAKGEREYNKQLPSVPRSARPRPGRDYFFNRESNTWTTA